MDEAQQKEAQKRFAVEVQVYLSEIELPAPDDALGSLPIRKLVHRHGEPFLNHWTEKEWQDREWEIPFVGWVLEQWGVQKVSDIREMPGFLSWNLCTSVDTGISIVTKVGGAFGRKQDLGDLLDCFARTGKRAKDPIGVSIVLDFDWAIREALRNPTFTSSRVDLSPLSLDPRSPLLDNLPDDLWSLFGLPKDEVQDLREPAGHGLPATVEPSVEIKQEQPTWHTRTIDPNLPPQLYDLTSPSPPPQQHKELVSLPDIPIRPKRTRSESFPMKRKDRMQAKSRKVATSYSADSAEHSYGTRHAEARQRNKQGLE
jgi:hypothetical protein